MGRASPRTHHVRYVRFVSAARETHPLIEDPSETEMGLGALIAGLKRTRQSGGDLRIAAAGDQVETVLRLTNLDRVLRPHPSVEAASDGW